MVQRKSIGIPLLRKIMSYEIPPKSTDEKFLKAREIAGQRICDLMRTENGHLPENEDYRWIRGDLTWPSFDHFNFAYGNQIFSVLVDIVKNDMSSLNPREVENCVSSSEKYNLVPCRFRVDADSMKPLSAGWNITHLVSDVEIIPEALITKDKVPMSEWELHNFGIQIYRDTYIKLRGWTLLSYCDVVGIDPQMWIETEKGERCWVIIRCDLNTEDSQKEDWYEFEKKNPQLKGFDGYFGSFSPTQYESIDSKSKLRSTELQGESIINRCDLIEPNISGLKRIYVC